MTNSPIALKTFKATALISSKCVITVTITPTSTANATIAIPIGPAKAANDTPRAPVIVTIVPMIDRTGPSAATNPTNVIIIV